MKSSPSRVNGSVQPREHVGDRRRRQRDAEEPRARAVRSGTGVRDGSSALHIGQRARASAADVEDQPRRALDGARPELEIDAALEAVAGVAREAEAAHLALDHGGIQNAPSRKTSRVVRDAAMLAAHDAGEARAASRCRRRAAGRVERERLAVQQLQRLARAREAHDDAPSSSRSS